MRKKQRHTKTLHHVLTNTYGMSCCFQLLILAGITFVCVQASTDPGSYTCTTINNTVIQLDWTAATDTGVTGYYVYLRRSDGLKTQEGPGIDLSSRSYISYTFYGLGFYAQYDISINSYSGGTNYTVYTATCTTHAGAPDISNFNLTCEGISYTEITCTWGSLDAVYWNGAPYGWQLGHISYYNDEYTYINVNSTGTLTYTITGLQFDTKYLINIRSVNTDGYMGPYSSTNSKTLGWASTAENETRYFCYEAIPGYLEISWKEMPCTIYSGAIAGLLLISLLLLITCCCMCCCKGDNKSGGNTQINIINEENNEYYGDDDDDDYDESEEEEEESEEEEEDDDDDDEKSDVTDGDESPTKAQPLAKKKKLSDDEVDESEDDEDETEDDEDSEKKKEEERKKKIRERLKKRNALMAGAATVKHVDETKKVIKPEPKEITKKKKESSDEESEGYYEDWNPDADENPDVAVNRKSMKDVDDSVDENKNAKNKRKDAKSDKKTDKKKGKNDKSKSKKDDSEDDDDYDDDDSDEYDSDDDEYSSEESVHSKPVKGNNKNESKDSGRGSASSGMSLWGDDTKGSNGSNKAGKPTQSSNDEPKKKGGFLSNLFGTTTKPKQENNSKTGNKQDGNQNNQSTSTQPHTTRNDDSVGGWGNGTNDSTLSGGGSTGNYNQAGVQTRVGVDQSGKPIVINAPTMVYSNPINNGSDYNNANKRHDDRPPAGYGRNPNGTYHPLPGNYNRNVPPGFVRNSDGSIERSSDGFYDNSLHDSNAPPGHANKSYQSGNRSDNNPPAGYAKNFDGTFYPVRGNTHPVVPPGYTRNPDGTIFKNKQHSQYNNPASLTTPPGYGKNPDGTFYPLPGNSNPGIPPGFARNHDGTIHRTTGTSSYQDDDSSSQVPPSGYSRNPDGSFSSLPSNRNPIVPNGYLKNPDGTIYKNDNRLNSQFTNNPYNRNAPPPQGYAPNPDGSFRPLPGNRNTFAPAGFTKNSDGTIRRNDNHQDTPPGYAKNPDGTFRPLPGNTNPVVPSGFSKNPDGTIRRNRNNNSTFSNNAAPPGYGKHPDGTFFPLKTNVNPVVPHGFKKNPDGTISKLPNNGNNQGTGFNNQPGRTYGNSNNISNSNRPYPYGPKDLDPPEIPDERDKFNTMFVAKAKQKAAQKKGQSNEYSQQPNQKPSTFSGDGEDIFASTNPNQTNADQAYSGINATVNQPATSGNVGSNNPGAFRNSIQNNEFGNPNQGNFGGVDANVPNSDDVFNNDVGPGENTHNQNGKSGENGSSNLPRNHQPFSFGNGNIAADTGYVNRKPISFRANDPKYNKFNAPNVGPNGEPKHGDTSDTEVLPDDRPNSSKRPIRFRNPKQTGAWNQNKPTNNPASDKSGKRTPVTELLPRQERQDLIEPEPVIGSDRLGDKFPFLNVNKKRVRHPTDNPTDNPNADTNPNDTEGSVKRNKSDSDLVMRGREVVNQKDLPKREFPPMPNTLSGEDAAIAASSNDLAGLKPETRDQIFYGFGVGRWRKHAATWLNKWKMKKKPVKTAKVSWD